VVRGKRTKMKRYSEVREIQPVKCRVKEVKSLQDSVMLGTYGGILHTLAVMYIIWCMYSRASNVTILLQPYSKIVGNNYIVTNVTPIIMVR
jgi:hypothetical protein